jgi:glycyl-tRNA synthetase beta chain
MHRDFLLELGTEDLPARYVLPLADALAEGMREGLARRGIGVDAARRYATPRRIAVLLSSVGDQQPDQQLERKGPSLSAAYKDGQATPAALGFARSCGVELADLAQENGNLVFRRTVPGKPTVLLLQEVFDETLKRMDELVPKRMRWGAGEVTFVRPVQWLLALFGEEVVELSAYGLTAGRVSYGHRFHAPEAVPLERASAYGEALMAAKVWADVDSRRDAIRAGILAEGERLGGRPRITDDLLEEVTALVEWPVVISGQIEERFLELPPEVIVSTVETNQRYFTVFRDTPAPGQTMRSDDGYLMPVFITVSNIESRDVQQVISGNERVVRPRLTDALFFWRQDLRQPLEQYGARLASVTFQKDLGSIADKVARVRALAGRIAGLLGADVTAAERAATLAKCDLVTRMVFEFPELQGLMGGYYARAAGEPTEVAQAVAQHYRPTQAGAAIPEGAAGRAVALADKLDSLAGIFAIGQKPTASKDPYALRRAALGALRICIEGSLDLDLRALLQAALEAQPAGKRDAATLEDLWTFVVDRLRGYSTDRGFGAEQFEALRAIGFARPLDALRRIEALASFQPTPAAASLAAADKRARNLLRQAQGQEAAAIDPSRFELPSEQALLDALNASEQALAPLRAGADYAAMLQALSSLKAPVDAFFEGVMVMADDPAVRGNRLALLARLDAQCREVADLSALPG